MTTVTATSDFLKAVFADAPGVFCIWTAPDRLSSFFPNTDQGREAAAAYGASRAADANVYFGLGLFDQPLASGRGEAAGVIAIGGLWSDTDFGPGHKNPVPPNEETARRILNTINPAPSLIVRSGGGWHVYWLFKKPWVFKDTADQKRAAALSKAWQAKLRRAYEAEGYTLDSTHDLARVLRLPGTLHRKNPTDIRPVEIFYPAGDLNGDLARYDITDFGLSLDDPPKQVPPPPQPPVNYDSASAVRRCLAYLTCCPDAISGNGGHKATLFAACVCYRFGLSDVDARWVMDQFNATKTGGEKWTDREIKHKLTDAKKKVREAGEFGSLLVAKKPADVPRVAGGRRPNSTSELKSPPGDGLVPLGSRDPQSNKLVLSPKRTLPAAEAFVREFHRHREGRTIHSYAGTLLVWRGNRFVEIEEETLRQKLQPWLHDALRYVLNRQTGLLELVDFESNPATITAAVESIRAYAHLPAGLTPPVWLAKADHLPDPRELLPCLSGNLHIPSGKVLQPTPALFNVNALDFDYDANADGPERWIRFLEELFGDDLESVYLLQEWIGYCLIGDTSQQKMLLLVGPRRSGKGTIGRVLARLVGVGNVVGPTTSSLAGPFGLQPLIGKSLAIVSDARFIGENIGVVVERLLCISGEDALTVDRKFLGSVTMRLPTRFMFLTNELPRMNDTSGALAGRFVILRLTHSFYGREDVELTAKLMKELPGILLWGIEGLKRLRARGRFVQPATVAEAVREMEDLASPVLAFVRDRCVVGPGHRIWVDDLYSDWRQWCEQGGRTAITNKQTFGRDLAAAVAGVARRRGAGDVPFYEGIALKGGLP